MRADCVVEIHSTLTLDYRPQAGVLEGLWVRLRGAWADFEDGASAWNTRLIVNYSLPLL